jgi:DNA polymerase-3 subunit beta
MLDRTTETLARTEIVVQAGELNDALRRVRHAICKEHTRYYLGGVYLHYVRQHTVLRFVATDGHRLAQADISTPQGADGLVPVILSQDFVADAIKATNKRRDAFRQVHLAIGPNHVRLTDCEGNVIDGELIDGTFPDYARVVPCGEPQHGTVTLAREPFMRAVGAATAFTEASEAKRPALRFAFAGDKLNISAAIEGTVSDYRGSASVSVDIAATTVTNAPVVGFFGPYILDILRSLKGRHVRFDFFDVGGPNNFAGDEADNGALHVIMPVRV